MLKTILLWILRNLSKKILKKYRPDIVGITGSIGKTSTKEAATAVLKSRFNVRSNVKNYNNEIGLPLTIIGVETTPGKSIFGWFKVIGRACKMLGKRRTDYPEILVLEMGADKPGDIVYLTDIAPCKVGVLTYIAHAHTEYFKTVKKIAQEKRVIVSHLTEDGFAVLNFDNDMVMQNAKTRAEVLTYGFKDGADFQATDVNIITDSENGWPTGLNFKVNHSGNIVPVFLPGIMAEHLIPSALAGMAVGHIFGVNLVDAASALRDLPPIPGHMCLIPGIKKTMLIDDTYNSSPEPTKSALKTLSSIALKYGAERYAVLGDMLELGPETENLHREIGLRAAELGVNVLITVGEASKHTASAAREAGMDEHRVITFADSASAGRFLQDAIKEGDVILIKGSQGVRMEKIVKELMAEPLRAPELLVRQTGEWEKK
ncbi:MAG: UDP-N-acetylmuramoyl-tripeptide--D-alanyl-D-alanine ligase [Candidatus Magasanikbacteria bacterium]|nr:UDP-N-acetylmuramoyl-tripeptide--D-alanyl-D-alanine ligase [Candidatus Magasanikbacteria bacterium]